MTAKMEWWVMRIVVEWKPRGRAPARWRYPSGEPATDVVIGIVRSNVESEDYAVVPQNNGATVIAEPIACFDDQEGAQTRMLVEATAHPHERYLLVMSADLPA